MLKIQVFSSVRLPARAVPDVKDSNGFLCSSSKSNSNVLFDLEREGTTILCNVGN
jgi:hypothetical protein